jgi:hypothetical protein
MGNQWRANTRTHARMHARTRTRRLTHTQAEILKSSTYEVHTNINIDEVRKVG